ncbi:hypothetical protein LBYZC6_46860 [Lacrimispora brassicae]
MYHSYRGMQGLFNIIFSAAAVFLLITTWSSNSTSYRVLLVVCALMFTVWQPGILYLKALKQAKTPMFQNIMTLSFDEEGILVSQGEESLPIAWENVSKVDRVRDMMILYMDRVHAYLLPDSVVGEKKAAVRGLIKEKLPPERRKRI